MVGLLAVVHLANSQKVALRLTVNKLKQASGAIVVSIFNQENTFPIDGKEYKKLSFAVRALSTTCLIKGLEQGDYAIAVFHDQNNDGICNLGLIGAQDRPA